METIILKVPDKKSRSFLLKILQYFDLVTIINEEPEEEDLLQSIQQGLKEVSLIEKGILPSKSAQDFLNEL